MERKLVSQGRNALTVTLPAKWIRSKNLRAGDVVNVETKETDILISAQAKPEKRETSVDITGCSIGLSYALVHGKYIEGFDIINVKHSDPALAQEIIKSLIGMIIEKHSDTTVTYKSVIATPEDNFQAVLRRAGHMLVQQARTLVLQAENKATKTQVKDEERMLDYNILYCLRHLNKYEKMAYSYKYFALCAGLEYAADQISIISQHIKKDKTLARKILALIEEYTKLIFLQDSSGIYKLVKSFHKSVKTNTFAEGLAYSLAESLCNFVGFLVDDDHNRNI